MAASFLIGKPVKWIEDRSENLQADSFARDYHIDAELGVSEDGQITGLKVKTIADHGSYDAQAAPLEVPRRPVQRDHRLVRLSDNAFVEVDGVYTNKPPGGVAYRCSFRVTEAVHAIERMVDIAAHESGEDPAEFRLRNFIPPEKFPYKSPTGWEYDSGNYARGAAQGDGPHRLRGAPREQAEKRERGELMGIGICSFTEIVGAGPSHDFDILGLKMFDGARSASIRRARSLARIGSQTQGQGHETTYRPDRRRGARLPGRATSRSSTATRTPRPTGSARTASRSTPVVGRRDGDGLAEDPRQGPQARRAPARGERGRPRVDQRQVLGQRARRTGSRRSRRSRSRPTRTSRRGWRRASRRSTTTTRRTSRIPFGSYICVVDIDKGTGEVKVRRFVAVDDCGNIINPMIVEGQIHGGLTMGLAPALYEEITYDENGNNLAGTFMDYLLPTAMETPAWETSKTITPSPHHPIGAKGVGESATVGAPPAIANAVVDALWHLGVRHIDIPITPQKVWAILHEKGIVVTHPRVAAAACTPCT